MLKFVGERFDEIIRVFNDGTGVSRDWGRHRKRVVDINYATLNCFLNQIFNHNERISHSEIILTRVIKNTPVKQEKLVIVFF